MENQNSELFIQHNKMFVGSKCVSNFSIEKLEISEETIKIKIINGYGRTKYDIDFKLNRLKSFIYFKDYIARFGNFFFWGDEQDFEKLLKYLEIN